MSYWLPILLAYAVVIGGIAYCELGIESRLVNGFAAFIQKPWAVLVILFACLTFLFWKVLDPDYIVFSNDGPMGTIVNRQSAMPASINGIWMDSDYVGSTQPCYVPSLSVFFRCVCLVPGFGPLMALLLIAGAIAVFKFKAHRLVLAIYGVSGVVLIVTFFCLVEFGVVDPQGSSFWNTVPVIYTATIIPMGLLACHHFDRKC